MRSATQSVLCLAMAVGLASCGGGGSGSGSPPTPTPQSLSITPGTTVLRVNQTETFAGTVTLTNGQSQTVQPTWQSDNTTVLVFENGGVARGRGNGNATIIATNQGLTATRLIRVATDYQGTWTGDYVLRTCDASGDFRDIDFCDVQDGFYVGEILPIALLLQQSQLDVNGDLALGGLEGTARGRVDDNGRFVGTGSVTYTEDGFSVVLTLDPLTFTADGNRLTGSFSVTVTAAGLSGQGAMQAELRTVTRSAPGLVPLTGHSRSFGSVKEVLRLLRR